VVATRGPTVKSTQALLRETANRLDKDVSFSGVTVEEAFDRLGKGDVEVHNELIADALRRKCADEDIAVVVLAQLSMTVFKLSYPDCVAEFGVPVLTSGEEGFRCCGQWSTDLGLTETSMPPDKANILLIMSDQLVPMTGRFSRAWALPASGMRGPWYSKPCGRTESRA